MKIRSRDKISVNLSMTETVNEKIIGSIEKVEYSGDFSRLVVTYKYATESDILIKYDIISFANQEIDDLRNDIETLLPNDFGILGEKEQTQIKFISGFLLIMSQTFDILIEDIEIMRNPESEE